MIIDNHCPFCEPSDYVLSNKLVYGRYDRYPVNKGHLLIIPYRHIADYFDTTEEEKLAMRFELFRAAS